jgi:hypothetical protein
MRHRKLFLLVTLLAISCGDGPSGGSHDEVPLGAGFKCMDRPDDPTGYLKPICEHLVASFASYPVDPNKLAIRASGKGSERLPQGSPYATDAFTVVDLNCCYTGDSAIIEVASKRVIEFRLGAI